jgi:hypothetical protein
MQSQDLADARSSGQARAWEEWTLVSRDPLDPSQLGIVGDALVWARCEGAPAGPIHELSVLMPVLPGEKAASAASFLRLGSLAQRILNWDRFSVRDLKERRLAQPVAGSAARGSQGRVSWLSGCDGAVISIVDEVTRFCSEADA